MGTLNKAAKGLSEDIKELKEQYSRLLYGLNEKFNFLEQRLGNSEEVLDAVTDVVGKERLQEIIQESRIRRAQDMERNEKKSLEQGVADGYVVKVEVAGEKSLIVGTETLANGEKAIPERQQLAMPRIDAVFRDQLLGKPAGTVLQLPNGGKFEVLEIYDVDEDRFRAVQEAKMRASAEAAATVAQEQAAADEQLDSVTQKGE